MKRRVLRINSGRLPDFYLFTAAFSILCFFPAAIDAQIPAGDTERASYINKENSSQSVAPAPFLKEYRNMTIGAEANKLRENWGKPKMEYSDGFLYELSDSETVQIVISLEKEITTIAVTFIDGKDAPAFADVFGDGIMPEKRENGSVYKMVRYPDAGYWVAYSAGPGENASVSVTMQKL